MAQDVNWVYRVILLLQAGRIAEAIAELFRHVRETPAAPTPASPAARANDDDCGEEDLACDPLALERRWERATGPIRRGVRGCYHME
jgi:hypothetical protein